MNGPALPFDEFKLQRLINSYPKKELYGKGIPMKTHKLNCKPPSPAKLALCIASALALSGLSGQAIAAGCSYTTTAQFLCDDQTIYYSGNPLTSGSRDYTTFTETLINTSQNGTTTPLQGWGVYLDSTGYKFKNLVINTTGSEADGIHSKNAGGKLVADNISIITTGTSSDGINLGRELTSASSIVEVSGNVRVDAANGMGLRANISRANASARSSIIVHGDADIATRGNGGANSGYGIYAGKDIGDILGSAAGTGDVTIGGTAKITTAGSSAYGVYAGRKGTVNLNDVEITTTGNGATGIYAYASTDYSAVNLGGDTAIEVTGTNSLAMSASRGVIRSWDAATDTASSGVYNIKGNLLARSTGVIDLTMEDGSQFVGSADSSQQSATVSTHGTLNLNMKGASSEWTMTGSSTVSALTMDQATLRYSPDGVSRDDEGTFKKLTVMGNYIGTNALLVLNTVLEGDESLTDQLIVKGDTSGNTNVGINNIGGVGEQTVEGIKIVEVAGNSDGTFAKAGRIVAGGYDYDVVKKEKDWYLTSQLSPVDPPEDPEPEPDPDPVDPVDPPGPPAPYTPLTPPSESNYRPEFGSYLANNYAANTMFITRLHDRLGETQYTDMLTGEEKVTSMWMRNQGGHTRFTDSSGQLKTTANRYVLQIGGDLAQWSSDGLDRWHLGAMAGYANEKNKTTNHRNHYASRGQVDGYSVGLYATWYANEADKSGTYLDSWVLYNWFDNTVKGDYLASDSYKSDGITASIEGGYSFLVGESENATYWIQPKAQVIWMDVQADTHRDKTGAVVKDNTDGNLMTRLGVKAYLKGHATKDEGKGREFQPFIEANWIHNTDNQAVQMGSIKDEMRGTRNIGELKVGVEGQITPRLQMWGNVAQQMGDNSYSDTSAMVGVKYSF